MKTGAVGWNAVNYIDLTQRFSCTFDIKALKLFAVIVVPWNLMKHW